MRQVLVTGVVVLITALSVMVTLGQAQAASTIRYDERGDTIARLDIARVVYRNAPLRVSAKIAVPYLQRVGKARLTISRYGTDSAYDARVRIGENGGLRKGFFLVGNLGSTPRRCAFDATWNAVEGYIRLSVPHRCIRGFTNGPAYLESHTGGTHGDWGPTVQRLARG